MDITEHYVTNLRRNLADDYDEDQAREMALVETGAWLGE